MNIYNEIRHVVDASVVAVARIGIGVIGVGARCRAEEGFNAAAGRFCGSGAFPRQRVKY